MYRTPCNQTATAGTQCKGSMYVPEHQCERCQIYNPEPKLNGEYEEEHA